MSKQTEPSFSPQAKSANTLPFGGDARTSLLLDALRVSVLFLDRWSIVTHANRAALSWCGATALSEVVGKSFAEVADSWDNPFERQREIMQVIRSGQALYQSLESSFERGRQRWYSVDKIPVITVAGRVDGVMLLVEDVTDNLHMERSLRETQARYQAFVANSTDAIWRYELNPPVDTSLPVKEQVRQILRRAQLVECNHTVATIFQLDSVNDILGTPLYMGGAMVDKNDITQFVENRYRLDNCECIGISRSGERVLLETSASGEVENGYLQRFWGSSRDVTVQKRYIDRMEYLATHDALTALPNRVKLYSHMEQALQKRHGGQHCALLLIDLDGFKEINDTLGHLAGDAMLKQIGPRFESELGDMPGIIARLGGDEFAIFLSNIRNAQHAVVMAHRFLDSVCQIFEIDGFRTEISASIGVAIAPEQANDVTTLMRYADIAMYHAKTGLKGVAVYDTLFDSHSPFRLELMGALGRAIRENQLRLHFQPKVRIADHAVYGFEALLRWEHPDLGPIPPGDFIPIAEKSNVIYPMTLWVMEETVKQCAHWVAQGLDTIVAMNLSARNLMDDRIVSELRRVLEKYNLAGKHLEMEITESMIMSDPRRAQLALERINALGVKLSVDDFGTGYSSLAYLKRLPVQSLKIDCAFVRGMLHDEQDEIIVNSTIQMAHNLGLDVVAEGVEDMETYRRLQSMGCDNVQGYYIARPMDRDQLEHWLAEGAWPSQVQTQLANGA